MGCASAKHASHSIAVLKEDPAPAATLLESSQNEQKAHAAAAAAQDPGQAERTKTNEQCSAAEAAHQDRVTKVTSNVVLVEFTPPEDEDEVEQPAASTPRRSKRKGTPWHGGQGAPFHIDDEIDDDDDTEEGKAAEPQELAKKPVERNAKRKATPWHKGGEALESDPDDHQVQGHEEPCKETDGAPESGSVFCLFTLCSRPCMPQGELIMSPR